MSNSNVDMTNVVIKTEPGRLSSFKQPRDLMLNGPTAKQPPKKLFTPNLNVVRNKNKHLLIVDHSKTKRKHDRFDKNDRSKTNQHKGSGVVKSTGVFSEGIATAPRRYHSREDFSGGNSRDPSSFLEKPVYKAKSEPKVEKDFEGLRIKSVSSDDDSEEEPTDSQLLPVRLPMHLKGLHLPKRNENLFKSTTQIKQEVVIKTEPVDDASPKERRLENDDNHKIKMDSFEVKDVVGHFQNPKSSLFMLQFPDSLPGRGPDSSSQPKDKSESTEDEPELPNVCTFDNIDEGQIGKLVIYKSGKVKMLIGNMHYDLSLGSQTNFKQDVMSISVNPEERIGTMINLGDIQAKLTVIPDWEKMLCEDELQSDDI